MAEHNLNSPIKEYTPMRDSYQHDMVSGGVMLNDANLMKDDPFKKDRFR